MSPKLIKDFPARVDFLTTSEMRCQLIALAYLMGAGGEISTPARNMMRTAIDAKLDSMTDKERAQYIEIYERVLIREGLKP